jgi:Galactokinase galactose-binding signature
MIAEQSIPVYTTLSDVFGSLTASLEHVLRWNNLAEEFEKRFGRKPTHIARAPGRIKYVIINYPPNLYCLSHSSLIGRYI